MARTQAESYTQRREAIIEQAAALFARFGFRGASMTDVAQACGTSKSLIYHYYASKEDMLYAVMLSHVDQLTDDVKRAMALDASPRERLRHLLRRFVANYVGAASRQTVLLNELPNLPDDKRRSIIGKERAVIDAVQGLIVAIDPALAANRAEARVQTMLLFGMINWTNTWFNERGTISSDIIADMAFHLISPARAV